MPDPHSASSFLQAVTEFVFVQDEPAPCDAIFIPGSAHPEHILHAADMYHAGYAPIIIPSGRYAIGSQGFAGDPSFETEWAWMHALLTARGVPSSAILREDQATYTWENAQFSRAVCDAAGLTVRRAMLCCRPQHARRALLYYQAAFPETAWLVCPADIPGRNRDDWYQTAEVRAEVLGEVRRLGSQINEVLEMMLCDPASSLAETGGNTHDHA